MMVWVFPGGSFYYYYYNYHFFSSMNLNVFKGFLDREPPNKTDKKGADETWNIVTPKKKLVRKSSDIQ